MKILIPSRSRPRTMSTPFQIPAKYMDDVTVYVAVEQKSSYQEANPNLNIKSVSTMNDLLGKKLELMARDAEPDDDLVMLCDDDFVFRLEYDGNQNTRLNGCIIYRRSVFLDERIEHDRMNPMNDFDVNLQLLRLGYDNHLIAEFCYNQGGTNAPGGSSDYRTLETQAASAHKLADLHPGFVNIRHKVNKTGPVELRERTEVTVFWKKARASAEA